MNWPLGTFLLVIVILFITQVRFEEVGKSSSEVSIFTRGLRGGDGKPQTADKAVRRSVGHAEGEKRNKIRILCMSPTKFADSWLTNGSEKSA